MATKFVLAATCMAAVVACSPAANERDGDDGGERTAEVSRSSAQVTSDPGINVAVRSVTPAEAAGVPVILVHGARVPGIASFDLSVPGYSLAEDLARAGHPTFIMDVRGYGASTRPPQMGDDPAAGPPLVRSDEVVDDIKAVVDHVQHSTGAEQVGIVGWATGGHWAGMYASLQPDDVSHLVIYNSLYGQADGHETLGRGSSNEDPDLPCVFNRSAGAYRLSDGPSLLSSWDRTIPTEDPTTWRDSRVAEAYQREALASDPTSEQRQPAGFRAPNGAMEDSFYLATGRQLWDASLIKANTLIIRSELDFWSRPSDVTDLQRHLTRAAQVRTSELAQATHYAHLDRPERGRDQFIGELLSFLQ